MELKRHFIHHHASSSMLPYVHRDCASYYERGAPGRPPRLSHVQLLSSDSTVYLFASFVSREVTPTAGSPSVLSLVWCKCCVYLFYRSGDRGPMCNSCGGKLKQTLSVSMSVYSAQRWGSFRDLSIDCDLSVGLFPLLAVYSLFV